MDNSRMSTADMLQYCNEALAWDDFYICRSTECLEKARKARRFEKSFSCKIEDSVYEVMTDELGKEPQDV